MSAKLEDLLARVEKAERPDRQLDADLMIFVGWKPDGEHMGEPRWVHPNGLQTAFNPKHGPVFRYTASIDDALVLAREVLPGFESSHGSLIWTKGLQTERVWLCEMRYYRAKGRGVTAPNAILAAVLRASPAYTEAIS